MGIAMEIPQAVGSHVGGLFGDHIFEHEVRTIFSESSGYKFDAGSYSWSTLLLPTLVEWPVTTFGTELDLGSAAFVNQFSTDLNTAQANSGMSPLQISMASSSWGAQEESLQYKHLHLKPSMF